MAGPASWLALWALLLGLAWLLRLHPRRDPPPGPVGRGPAWSGVALVVPILALGGTASWLLRDAGTAVRAPVSAQLMPLAVQRVQPQQVDSLLPEVVGAGQRWHHSTFAWAEELFGTGSRFERFAFQGDAAGERLRWVDVVIAPRVEDLERHGLEGCYRWHSYDLDVRGTCLVGAGLVGERYVVTDDRQRRWAAVNWLQPVLVDDATWWRRTTIQRRIADGDDAVVAVDEVTALARRLAAPQPTAGASGGVPAGAGALGSR